jgi:TPR repeat protein
MIVKGSYDSAFDSDFSNAQGMRALKTACDGGEADACRELAGAVEPAEAAPILEKLCNGGDNVSCDELVDAYRDSDPKRADDLLEKRCDAWDNDSCRELATGLLGGSDVAEADSARASALLTKACDRGAEDACVDLGDGYLDGSFGSDPDRARDIFVKGCNGGDSNACFEYNKMLVDSEPAKALKWFTADCKYVARGCDAVGDLYRVGANGIAPDPDRARSFYRRACQAGLRYSCDKRDCFDAYDDACDKAYEDQQRVRYRLGGRFDIR